jgi:hypothetical protein
MPEKYKEDKLVGDANKGLRSVKDEGDASVKASNSEPCGIPA